MYDIFSQSSPGVSRMEADEEEEEENEDEKVPKNKNDLFSVCGTLFDSDAKPSFPVEIIPNEEASIQTAIMSSDIIIYSLAEGTIG